jgi:hypothetical protein
VTVLAQSELIPLLGTVRGIDRLLALETGDDGLNYEVEVEVMELPHVFRTTLATIPVEIPYIHWRKPLVRGIQSPSLHPPPRGAGEDRGGGATACLERDKLAVGIVWAAGDWDRGRSIPASLLAPLANVPGIELQIFQVGEALAEPREWDALIPQWDDIVMEAGLIRALDLMISVDSLPAHLAAALGVPVWTLLQKEADWRWMEARDDSPWYPTMRLFRQQRAGEWRPVIAAVAAELRNSTAQPGALDRRSRPAAVSR